VPIAPRAPDRDVLAPDDPFSGQQIDRITEEALLHGLAQSAALSSKQKGEAG
jgi:hypothetical protein